MPLGSETYSAYVYDRGGQTRLAEFDHVSSVHWGRVLCAVSTARVTLALPGDHDCCTFLGDLRSGRHELVLYRGGQRVWEGPITRLVYGVRQVIVQASDLAWWFSRRSNRGLFTDAINGVTAAVTTVQQALADDDPNMLTYLRSSSDGAPAIVVATNPYEQDYLDSLDDFADLGVNWTMLGRSLTLWPATQPIGVTPLIRSSDDLVGEVSVVEDGLALATRVNLTQGDTWGSTTPEPVVTNWATNPSLESTGTGFESPASWWTLSRPTAAWGSGARVGQVVAGGPAPPASGATDAKKRAYDQTVADFNSSEVMLTTKGQKVAVHEGELLSAILSVRQVGAAPAGVLGLSLTSINADGVVSDRAFAEGPPVLIGSTNRLLFCTGKAPANARYAFVSVFRDTSDEARKWALRSGKGFQFDMLGIFRGRIESWFDGNTADTADFDYAWTGSTNYSPSRRTFKDPDHVYVDPYYGLVEALEPNAATTAATLAVAAETMRDGTYPTPMYLDIPQDAPLNPESVLTVDMLMPGVTVPVQSNETCRDVSTPCTLDEVKGSWTTDGEKITVTLVSGQVYQEFEPDQDANPDAVVPPPNTVPDGSGGQATPSGGGGSSGGGQPTPPTPAPPPVKRAWSSSPTVTLAIKSIPGAYTYLQAVCRLEAQGGQPVQYVMAQDVKGDTRFLLFNASGSYAGQWMIVKGGGHGSSFHAYRNVDGSIRICTWYKEKGYRFPWKNGKSVSASDGWKQDFKGGRPVGSHEPYIGFRTATSTRETLYLFNRVDFQAGSRKPRRQVTLSKRSGLTQQTWAVTDSRVYRLLGATNQNPCKGTRKHVLDVFNWAGTLLLDRWDVTGMCVPTTSDEPEGLTFTGTPGNLMIGKREGGSKANRSYPIWTITGLP